MTPNEKLLLFSVECLAKRYTYRSIMNLGRKTVGKTLEFCRCLMQNKVIEVHMRIGFYLPVPP